MNVLKRKSECRAVSPDLWDYVGERLPENSLERVERHLTVCASCQNEVEGMRRAQNLLRDCRSQVPAPRSDWHDLQDRMRAEGMISPLSGRILLHNTDRQRESVRTSRRSLSALNWERLSLAGSVAATLLLSISIYRLTTLPTQNFTAREANSPAFSAQLNTDSSRETAVLPYIPADLGDPYRPLLARADLIAPTPPMPRRNMAVPSITIAQNQQSEPQETEANIESPIVWNQSLRLQSSASPQKYKARELPSQSKKTPDDTAFVSPTLDIARNDQDAKTRYIMQRLTPASFIEEEGIY